MQLTLPLILISPHACRNKWLAGAYVRACVCVCWDSGHIRPTNLTGMAKKVLRFEPRKTIINEKVTGWH